MTQKIFAYVRYKDSEIDDSVLELATAAGKIVADAAAIAIVVGAGDAVAAVSEKAAAHFSEVWKFDSQALAYPNAELIRMLLVTVLPEDAIVLVPHDTFGMDLSPGLSVKIKSVLLSDVVAVGGRQGEVLKVSRQEYGGAVSTHVEADISDGAVINIRPGVFKPAAGLSAAGTVVDKSSEIGELRAGRRFLDVVEAEVGDVDITKSEVLVSVGRGIEDEENIEIVGELAEALGADVSCSRPVVDAKWLEKSRQVGTSGQTVKPKVYMALGISGSFQHLGGIKGTPFIVAVNKNAKAPIFQVASVGVVADILEFVPELTEKLKEI